MAASAAAADGLMCTCGTCVLCVPGNRARSSSVFPGTPCLRLNPQVLTTICLPRAAPAQPVRFTLGGGLASRAVSAAAADGLLCTCGTCGTCVPSHRARLSTVFPGMPCLRLHLN